MGNLEPLELKAYVPAKDFELSKQFYQDIGFTVCWSEGGLALLHFGAHTTEDHQAKASFLLQEFYVKEHAENTMMHLLVEDVDAWWALIEANNVVEKYGVMAQAPALMSWNMRDMVINDPTGVLWRISQPMPDEENAAR